MKLGHLTCVLLQIAFFLPNINDVNAQNQQMYIHTGTLVNQQVDKTTDPARRTTTTTMSDNNPPITNIHKDSVKIGDSTPISAHVSTTQMVRDAKTQANQAHLIGTATYRAVVEVPTHAVLQVAPNPVTDVAMMTIAYEGVPMQADCSLTDIAGKVLWQKQIQIADKMTQESLIINELPKGLYLMRVQIGTTFLSQKIVKW